MICPATQTEIADNYCDHNCGECPWVLYKGVKDEQDGAVRICSEDGTSGSATGANIPKPDDRLL